MALSEFQMGLGALGVVVIAGVFVFNKWQERKYRKAARGFESGHEDVLLGKRPVAATAPEPARRVEPQWNAPDEPDAAPAAEEGTGPVVSHPAPSAEALADATLDDRIDYILELAFSEPLSGADAAALVADFDTQRHIGIDAFNAVANAWEAPLADARYERIRIGLQFTDRSGPVRESDLAAFHGAVEHIAATRAAGITALGPDKPLTHAAQLDSFCAAVDVQIGISLVAEMTFAETKFRGLAEANGFVREDDGVFRRRDDEGREILTLRQTGPATVTFALDVPRVPRQLGAFGMLANCARSLAKGLDAHIIDDNRNRLDEAALSRILQDVNVIHGRMEAAGLPSGGALALRLFA
jgi:hypothetical protein